jgi:hypothetical protein
MPFRENKNREFGFVCPKGVPRVLGTRKRLHLGQLRRRVAGFEKFFLTGACKIHVPEISVLLRCPRGEKFEISYLRFQISPSRKKGEPLIIKDQQPLQA